MTVNFSLHQARHESRAFLVQEALNDFEKLLAWYPFLSDYRVTLAIPPSSISSEERDKIIDLDSKIHVRGASREPLAWDLENCQDENKKEFLRAIQKLDSVIEFQNRLTHEVVISEVSFPGNIREQLKSNPRNQSTGGLMYPPIEALYSGESRYHGGTHFLLNLIIKPTEESGS